MNLKQLRRKRAFTQEELAERVGVHESTIRLWEQGKREPRSSDIKKLCEVLNCTEAELLNEPQDGRIQITISWNWEEMKKGVIDMDKDKFKLILGEDGAIGLQGAGKFTNREAINDFIAEVRNQLEIAFDAQVRRGAIQEA